MSSARFNTFDRKTIKMNWRLIFVLSLFGLGMAFATVFQISSASEPFVWLPIYLLCSYFIAMHAPDKYFLHGFLTSMANCVWITGVHIWLFKTYMTNHITETQQYMKMQAQHGISVRKTMLLMDPVIGIISGTVLGLLAFAASKMFGKVKGIK